MLLFVLGPHLQPVLSTEARLGSVNHVESCSPLLQYGCAPHLFGGQARVLTLPIGRSDGVSCYLSGWPPLLLQP